MDSEILVCLLLGLWQGRILWWEDIDEKAAHLLAAGKQRERLHYHLANLSSPLRRPPARPCLFKIPLSSKH